MNKIRIFTLSLLLGLVGAYTAAWGAESVMSLISTGEALQSEVQSTKTAMDDLIKENKQQAAEGQKLQGENKQLVQDIGDWQKQNDGIKQNMADYKVKCQGKQLNQDDYKACKAQLDEINASITKINNDNAVLVKRQNDFKTRADKFNEDVKTLPQRQNQATDTYKSAFQKEQSWLYQARTLVASEAFQPYAKKANCPDAQKSPKTEDQVNKLSQDILACLKRVSGTN